MKFNPEYILAEGTVVILNFRRRRKHFNQIFNHI